MKPGGQNGGGIPSVHGCLQRSGVNMWQAAAHPKSTDDSHTETQPATLSQSNSLTPTHEPTSDPVEGLAEPLVGAIELEDAAPAPLVLPEPSGSAKITIPPHALETRAKKTQGSGRSMRRC
jgi:hypothetical protein